MTDQMTPVGGAPRRRGPAASGGGALSNPAVRAALLIVLAIIIGIVLLQVIDDGSGPIGDGGTTTTTAASTTSTSRGTTTTTKADPKETGTVRTPQQVTVLVLNGSGVGGAAATVTNSLRALGYQTLPASDAPAQVGNTVYYQSGYKRECAAVATTVGGNAGVKEMPTPVPTGAERANCLAILGT
ncbi:LytR cell envelope-related transcriptional attenuator [Actinobacteria bacterium IMCC26256]|nr:LytR cell envelope-related transcriptional attenuator [Actinobacteria bacterium IMCC26256]